MDIDGVFTNGRLAIDQNGLESKEVAFLDLDGYFALKRSGLRMGFITGEKGPMADWFKKRFEPDYFYSGCKDKAGAVSEIAQKENIPLSEICFIGDSVHDLPALRLVGKPACPANALNEVKSVCQWKLKRRGGDGAIWELSQKILKDRS